MEWFHTIGLNTKQQKIYVYLLEYGASTASELAAGLEEQRTNIYLLMNDLIEKELIVRSESQPVVHFKIANPVRLQELMTENQTQVARSAARLRKELPELLGQYHLHTAGEGFAYFTGVKGYKATLDEPLRTRQEVCVFSTARVNDRPDLWDMLQNSLQKRAAQKVSTRMLLDPSLRTKVSITDMARKRIELQFWGVAAFQSEIALCGDTTVLTTYDDQLTSIVIKNKLITATFQAIFDTAWGDAKKIEVKADR